MSPWWKLWPAEYSQTSLYTWEVVSASFTVPSSDAFHIGDIFGCLLMRCIQESTTGSRRLAFKDSL